MKSDECWVLNSFSCPWLVSCMLQVTQTSSLSSGGCFPIHHTVTQTVLKGLCPSGCHPRNATPVFCCAIEQSGSDLNYFFHSALVWLMAGTGLLLQNECCVPERPAATVTTLNCFTLNWCRCLILMKNEVSFLLKSSKCGSSIRICTDGKADSCECISGSFAENEAGDCNVVAGQSTMRVSGSLCYRPAYLCVNKFDCFILLFFSPQPSIFNSCFSSCWLC